MIIGLLKLLPEGFAKLFCDFDHSLGIDLEDLTVVGVKAVCFVLDVADLSVDGGAKAALYHRDNLVKIEGLERVGKFFAVGKKAVAVGLVEIEGVTFDLVRISSELGEDERL